MKPKFTELDELWSTHANYRDFLKDQIIEQGENYFLEYRAIKAKFGAELPDELLDDIAGHDVYELPLARNRKLITEQWKAFAAGARTGSDIHVFDCCFIQNPVTVGMIKYGSAKEAVLGYVAELAAIAGPLKPLLIYVEQNDLDYSFRKAVQERPAGSQAKSG